MRLDRRYRGDSRALRQLDGGIATTVMSPGGRDRRVRCDGRVPRRQLGGRRSGRSNKPATNLSQFDLRGPFTASFADRSVIDAHRGRIERARQTLLAILGRANGGVHLAMVCHSALGALEFSDGKLRRRPSGLVDLCGRGTAVRWVDNLEDRSEPDHVEALSFSAGSMRRAACSSIWSGAGEPCPDRGSMRVSAGPSADPGRGRQGGRSAGDPRRGACDADVAVRDGAPASRPGGQLERRTKFRKLAARDSLTCGANVVRAAGLAAVGATYATRDRPPRPPSPGARMS